MTSYIISAAPSQGKSLLATKIAVDLLKEGKTVFSNYPIIYSIPFTFKEKIKNLFLRIKKQPLIQKKQLSSNKWDDNYIDCGLHDCTIILDEAYKLVDCHCKLTASQHDFFATTGHNNVDIYVIAQNYARINLVIREMATFYIVSKFSNPFSLVSKNGRKELTPLFFTLDIYLSERDYNLKGMKKDALYKTKRVWFNKDIAEAYQTQYYRQKAKPITVISWLDDMKQKDDSTMKEIIKKEREEKMKNEFILQV